ncbi:hypothetical protein CSUB01_12630, partial [Colletotrichum sublineola]
MPRKLPDDTQVTSESPSPQSSTKSPLPRLPSIPHYHPRSPVASMDPDAASSTESLPNRDAASDLNDRDLAHVNPPKPISASRYQDQTQYPVHRIVRHRCRKQDGAVQLLVQWGDEWLNDEPTWELEDDLWTTCRQKVLQFWTRKGENRRTSLLRLDHVQGPFTIGSILGERRSRKKARTGQKGTRTRQTTTYLVDFVGYQDAEWLPAAYVPDEWIKAWEEAKEGGM